MASKQDFKTLNRAALDAEGAFVDGRLKNIAFKHKQLRALFRILQDNGDALLNGTSSSGRLALELEHCLKVISETIKELPSDLVKAAKALRALVDAKASQGRRACGSGTVLIVTNDAHPIASWVIPLVTAIYDGNAAVVTFSPESSRTFNTLRRPLHLALDQSSFHFLEQDPSSLSAWIKSAPPALTGVVCLGGLQGGDEAAIAVRDFTVHAPARGHNPVIVDQSVLPSGSLQEMARTRDPDHVPHAIQDIAASIAQAHHLARGASEKGRDDKNTYQTLSSGLPGYVLVHENVLTLLMQALEASLPSNCQPHVQDLGAAEDILASGNLDYLPIFSVRSLDHAMDTINNRLPASQIAYVFGEERFGSYAAQHLSQKTVAINDIPRQLAVNGAYASRKDVTIAHDRVFWVAKKPTREYETAVEGYKSLKVAKLHQAGGFRIDFFGGSFLFAASIFLTCFLGTSGWAVYRGGLLALARWRGM